MNLVLDIGNTTTKAALFNGEQLVSSKYFDKVEDLLLFIQQQNFRYSVLASVNEEVASKVLKTFKPTVLFDANTSIPILNSYKTPETLGVDRIAGVIGASTLFPQINTLVIDAGTCITYDIITDKNEYLGGMITPGPELKSKALNNFTSALPLVNIVDTDRIFGDTTHSSILSGIIQGSVAEMEGLIAHYKNSFPEMKVILCGGWAKLFESKIKASIFVEPNLVLIGLNAVLKNNA